MARTLFISAAPAYSHPHNLFITFITPHVARLPCNRKYNDEDVFCNGRTGVYREFRGYLNRVWMKRSMGNKYYEKAMEIELCNHRLLREYVELISGEFGDTKKADEIY